MIYGARMNLNEEERAKLIFGELENLEEELFKKSGKIKKYSSIFQILNTVLNLTIIISSAIITILTAIYNFQNIPAIVLGGIIFFISSTNELLKLGARGYYYRQGSARLRRILGQIRDILYMYHTFNSEQILAFLSSFRAEIDEIDLDLYKSSMSGDVKFGNDIRILDIENQHKNSDSHIHIHIDTTPSSSPQNSPHVSPKNTPHISPNNSPYNSPHISPKNSPYLPRTISAPLQYNKNSKNSRPVLKRVDSAPVISVENP